MKRRVSVKTIAALRPMRARRPQARLAMLSTAWSRTDPFWTAWVSDDPSLIRLQATVDMIPRCFQPYTWSRNVRRSVNTPSSGNISDSGLGRRQPLHLGAL